MNDRGAVRCYITCMAITLVSKSGNAKTGFVGATYRKVGETCPSTCAHLVSNSCYALTSFTGITQRRSDRSEFDGMNYAAFITGLTDKQLSKIGNTVRLHVSGDFFYQDGIDTVYVQGVKTAHTMNPHVLGYTYTHRWQDFGAYNWPANLVVNASCDTLEDIHAAQAAGWPTVTTTGPNDTRKRWEDEGVTFLTCPAQTANLTCAQCRLCMKSDRKFTIVFRAHGTSKNKVKDVVNHLQGLDELTMS